MNYRLPTTDKNSVFRFVESIGLDPNDFEWAPFVDRESNKGSTGERVRHRPTDYTFSMTQSNEQVWCVMAPALPNGTRYTHAKTDRLAAELLMGWLRRIKEEHEAPDLWGQLQAEAAVLTSGAPGDQAATFSAAERKLIGERLDAVETRILTVAGPSASPEQRAHIHEIVVGAKSAADRMSKKDWKLFFLGSVTNMMMTLALEPSKARDIMHFIAITVGPLLSRIQSLLG